jgi:putative MATE family efflux protein
MNTKLQDRKELILHGSIFKSIITLSLPLMLGNFVQTLYGLADAYWVGNGMGELGDIAFASISYVWPITFIFIALSIGLNVASTSLISQAVGQDDYRSANRILGQYFSLAVVVGSIFSVIGYFLAPELLRLMGAEGTLYDMSKDYLQVMFLELPLLFLYNVYRSSQESQGDTLSPTIILVFSVILNIVLDPIFIIVLDLGVKGAAMATVISRFAVSWYVVYKLFSHKTRVFVHVKDIRLDIPVMKNLLKIALPSSAGHTISALGFAIMNGFILSYGADTVAAFGLGNRVTNLFMMPAFGVGGALSAFIGQNIGAKHFDRAKRSVLVAISFSFSLLVLGSIIVYFAKGMLITFFIPDSPSVFGLSMSYLNVLCFVFPLMAIFQGFLGVFSGSGHTKYVLVLSMSRLWLLRIPMIILSKNFTNLGSDGIWYAMLLSNFIVCLIGYVIIQRGHWLKGTLHLDPA